MSNEGVPVNSLRLRKSFVRLMSSPNSVGIDPASARSTFLKQVVDSYYHTRQNEQRGRTSQLVAFQTKVSQLDELAEFGGD